MNEIKRIDASEFQQVGYLQEANRLFFHLHGLSLEITSVNEDGWSADNPRVKAMADAIDRAAAEEDLTDFDVSELVAVDSTSYAVAAMNALYPPGSKHISGCWDYRDDPEGVVFGSWYGQDTAKAEAVAAERERHREARTALFGGDSDIEPLGYVYEESGEASP